MFYYISRIVLVVVLALIAAILHQSVLNTREQITPVFQGDPGTSAEIATVVKVIDGDTIELASGQRVRYIGIDTSEVGECFYKEATEKNKELVLGKQVQLVQDVNNTDKYGRLLRYAYVDVGTLDVSTFVNAELVRQGFAVAHSYSPDIAMQKGLREAERKARENMRGLWADDACKN